MKKNKCGLLLAVLLITPYLSSCNLQLTNYPNITLAKYYAVSSESIKACGKVKIEGKVGNKLETGTGSGSPSDLFPAYLLSNKETGHVKTTFDLNEQIYNPETKGIYFYASQVGTYVFSMIESADYKESLTLTCVKTGRAINFTNRILSYSSPLPLVTYINVNSDGTLVIAQKAFPKESTPAEMNLP